MAHLNRRVIKRASGVVALIVVLACGSALVPRERLLMNEAKKITTLPARSHAPCFWRSDRSVILMSFNKGFFALEQLDAETGSRKPLDTINRKYRSDLRAFTVMFGPGSPAAPGFRTENFPPPLGISADGQSLIFIRSAWTSGMTSFDGVALDGANQSHWRCNNRPDSAEGPAVSRPWLLYCRSDFDVNADVKSILLSDASKPGQDQRVQVASVMPVPDYVGITDTKRILRAKGMFGGPSASVQMIDYAVRPPAVDKRQYTVRLPMDASVQSVVLSNKGDSLAWLLLYDDIAAPSQWVRRVLPSFPSYPRAILAIWVSKLDGSRMTELGHNVLLRSQQENDQIANMQWLPGDRKISFIYRDALYTASVP